MSKIFLTSGSTFIVPVDWNSTANTIEVLGGGANGAASAPGEGGGGGAYSAITNLALTPGDSITYHIGAAGADSWFNGASLGASSVGAKGGNGQTGGASASGVGTTKFSGGNGGNRDDPTINGGGGGGAAGPNGNGVVGAAGSAGGGGTGGAGDNSSGGAGGTANNAGGNGTEWDSTHGSGGGGGGGQSGFRGGAGGNYGAGGGGGSSGALNGAGNPGIVVLTYTSTFTNARFWVGGAGNWDAATTTHWSLTSGGPGGASVPTSSNDVVFDANSGSGTITVTATADARTVTFFGFTQTLDLGSQTINLDGTGTVWNPMTTAFTLTAGTSTIKITDTSSTAKTFDGGGFTYHNMYITGAGTGTYSILGANTWNDFKADTPPHTIMFEGGKRQTVTTFTVNGTAGNLMTLHSTVDGTQWELACASQIVCDYLSLKDSRGVQLT